MHNCVNKDLNDKKRKIIRKAQAEPLWGEFEPRILSNARTFIENVLASSCGERNSGGIQKNSVNVAAYCISHNFFLSEP